MATDDRTARWNRYWDKKSATYDREIGFFDRHLFGDSRQWVCGQATGTTLEVAVGTGLNLPFYPGDVTLTGIDRSQKMLDLARARAADLGHPATLQQADAHHLPFGDASFDTVVCTFGLCAIPDHIQALNEMTRVLRPGGNSSSSTTSAAAPPPSEPCNAPSNCSPFPLAANTFYAAPSTTCVTPPASTLNTSNASHSASSNASPPAKPRDGLIHRHRHRSGADDLNPVRIAS
ncbi:class I SAM-dependent methyltransferase [Mycolicibacterium goodii]|uniref:class I SAM-dependent methyltransferase n=1 Tax=Mycolicibacterium goodii TaxID=134601 RepID=UPI00256EF159